MGILLISVITDCQSELTQLQDVYSALLYIKSILNDVKLSASLFISAIIIKLDRSLVHKPHLLAKEARLKLSAIYCCE